MRPHRQLLWIITLLVATSAAWPWAPAAADANGASMSELWVAPGMVADRDLFFGPWGAGCAPDPHAVYTFVRRKTQGVNPGVVVRDAQGREWHVKQGHPTVGFEGPVEVVLSRVLSAMGYHQPPVYFLPAFTMTDGSGTHVEPGGRFRLHDPALSERGGWSWRANPFVDTQPYAGLLVMLVMFNSADLKDSNNSVYDIARGGRTDRWYVVRDLGSALGGTSGWRPRRNNVDLFERSTFIKDVSGRGFVEFAFPSRFRHLVHARITPADVGWAMDLLGGLTVPQWNDAFRAGGYTPDVASRYIGLLRNRIIEGRAVVTGQRQSERR